MVARGVAECLRVRQIFLHTNCKTILELRQAVGRHQSIVHVALVTPILTRCPGDSGDLMTALSEYVLEFPCENQEFILYRSHPRQGEAPSVVLLAPFSTHSAREGLKKIEHECSFKTELAATRAVRPLALSQYNKQPALVLGNPGGEHLNRLIQGPMEMRQCLRLAISGASALSRLHKRELIHKDRRPTPLSFFQC